MINQSPQNQTSNTLRKRRAKPPIDINLTGLVGELVAAEFEKQRLQVDRLEAKLKSYEDLLLQIVRNTQYPIKIYTEDDFTALFGVKKRTQQNYRNTKKLDCIKPGEKVLYTQQHIDEFIARFDSRNLNKNA
ncbi:MAG: helix-turn-helix domain-containing protein [Paludibacter sp.]